MSFLKWKIWGVLGAVLGVIFMGLKIRGDHYKQEAKDTKAELEVSEINSEVKEFRAVNIEREKEAQNGKMDIKPNTTYSF